MKKTLFFLLITLVSSEISFSQKLERIKGSKNIIQSERTFDTLTGLELHKNIKINLIQSQENKLVIQADDNLHSVVITTVKDGMLDIDLSNRIASKKKFELNLYLTNLNHIILQDDTYLYSGDFFDAEEITLELSDHAEAILLFDTQNFTLNANDDSKGNLVIKSDKAFFTLEENTQIEAQTDITDFDLEVFQKATVTLKGKAKHFTTKAVNSTKILSSNLKVKKAAVEADNHSLVYVNVSSELTVKASGKSKIHIYGKPDIELKTFKDSAILFKE